MGGFVPYAQHEPPFAVIPPALVRVLSGKRVGRNGWTVAMALCCGVHEDGAMDVRSAEAIAGMTGLTRNQVARGMAELHPKGTLSLASLARARDKGVIVAVPRKNARGYVHPDRSNFGHVAQYCFTKKAWERLQPSLKRKPDDRIDDAQGESGRAGGDFRRRLALEGFDATSASRN